MKKTLSFLAVIVIIFSSLFVQAQYQRMMNSDSLFYKDSQWQQKFQEKYSVVDSSQFIIKVDNGARKQAFVNFLVAGEFTLVDSIPPYYLCRSSNGPSFLNAFTMLRSSALFEQVTYNKIGYIDSNDPYFEFQKHLSAQGIQTHLGLGDAWQDYTYGNKKIIVAVIDGGFNWKHEDLGYGADGFENVWKNVNDGWVNDQDPTSGNGIDDDGNGYIDDHRGWDFFYNNNDPNTQFIENTSSQNYHGNQSAGIISAKTNNQVGIAGVAGGNGDCINRGVNNCGGVQLMLLNVLQDYISKSTEGAGTFTYWHLAKALHYAVNNGARVVNMSLSGPDDNEFFSNLIFDLKDKYDVTIVSSAGNRGQTRVLNFPANHPLVYGVSGVSQNGQLLYQKGDYSAGKKLDFVAYANEVPTTGIVSDGYLNFDQTSCATPQVSGVFALLYSLYPCATDHLLYEIMKEFSHREPNEPSFLYDGNRNSNLYGYGWPDITRSMEGLSENFLTQQQHNVSSNITLTSVKLATEDIMVQAGGSLTISSELYMPEGSKIIVQPGGKLIIDGGYIGSGCSWEGIKVYGDPVNVQNLLNCGLVEVKNAGRIESARIGIESINKGIIQTKSDAIFKNNLEAIVFSEGVHKGSHKLSSIDDTKFISTGPYVSNIGTVHRKQGAVNFIRMNNVNGVQIVFSTFENQYWEAHSQLCAIRGFKVANTLIEGNYFSNLEQAVYLTSIAGTQSMITLQENIVENTNKGFQIINADTRIEGNSFSINRAQTFAPLSRFGIYTHGCINRISNNTISLNSPDVTPNEVNGYGIIVRNSRKIAESFVDRNQISDIRFGTQLEQLNPKLQLSCNDYTNNTVHAWSVNPTFTGILPEQGSGLEGPNRRRAGNLFFDRNLDASSLRHIRSGIAFTYNAATDPIQARPVYTSASVDVNPFDQNNASSCGTTLERGIIECNGTPCNLSQLEARINSSNTARDSIGIYQLEYLRQLVAAENFSTASTALYQWTSNADQVLNEYAIETAIQQEDWVKSLDLLNSIDTSLTRNIQYKRFYEIIRHKLKNQIALDSLTSSELSILQIIAGTTTDVADLAKTYLNALHAGSYALEPEQWQAESSRSLVQPFVDFSDTTLLVQKSLFKVDLYPNPTEGQLNFRLSSARDEEYSLVITNVLGQVVWKEHFLLPGQVYIFLLKGIENGIYFVKFLQGNEEIVKKIIVK